VEAREWFVAAAMADDEGTTDAAERIDELDAGGAPANGSAAAAAALDQLTSELADEPAEVVTVFLDGFSDDEA
jgi:hypothetical protein